jgi:hypothetical protein
MRTFKNPWFTRFAAKEGITDEELKGIVNQLEAGQADADLGGDVYKVRKARPGAGKAGGYRVIVFFRRGERTFYHYGFATSDRANIRRLPKPGCGNMTRLALSLNPLPVPPPKRPPPRPMPPHGGYELAGYKPRRPG